MAYSHQTAAQKYCIFIPFFYMHSLIVQSTATINVNYLGRLSGFYAVGLIATINRFSKKKKKSKCFISIAVSYIIQCVYSA